MSAILQRSTVWAFDLGKASLGEAVRDGATFPHIESWLIPEDLARRGPATTSGTPASRYRAMKTREAHRAREERLRALCAEAGIEVLAAKRVARDPGTKKFHVVQEADKRLQREFPKKGDDTCYTSCLLRIKLLQGEELKPWQIFKALHSAIQRRGYDANLAWKNRGRGRDADNDEGDTAQRAGAYRDALTQMAPEHPEFHLPCYLDAYRLGLWSPANPGEMKLRIDHRTEPARNRGEDGAIVAPRDLVVAEVRQLVEAAAKSFPLLAGRADEILFGPGARAYASYYPELRQRHGLRRGGANDWAGILGQKVPRFDNRIIAKCALIPRLNVCKAEPRELADGTFAADSLLPAEVTFLLKLKNARVERGTGGVDALTAPELKRLFDKRHPKGPANYSFTKKQWAVALAELGLRPAAGHEEIAAPRNAGRSRFCRPALRILRELLLSGRTPAEQRALEMEKLAGNTDPHRGLVAPDLAFLRRMGDSWTRLYVPDQQYDQLLALRESEGRDAAIRTLTGSSNNPIVRHRLEVFWGRLQALEKKFGPPGEVVLEFVRQDFMGEEAKKKLFRFQNDRAKARKEARERAGELKNESRSAALKCELLAAQGFVCLYTGAGLGQTSLDDLEIEHIVPRSQGGPDAMVNYVVTTKATNDAKGDRTPYEWFAAQGRAGWDAYVARVKERATALRAKKVRLLTEPDAAEQVQRYTALAETAYIARLAQTLVALHFGWPIRSEEGARRITIVNGGLTARVRRNYRLNSLLNPCPEGEDPRDWEEKCEKNRADKRHHALDAMVISFIPGWARDPEKEGFFRLPDEVRKNAREFFGQELDRVIPEWLSYEKPILAETFYGSRSGDSGQEIVQRVPLRELALKPVAPGKSAFDLAYLAKQIKSVRDPIIAEALNVLLANKPDEAVWLKFCADYCLPGKNGAAGPRVKKVTVTVGPTDEYCEMSKDGHGAWRRAKKGHKGQLIFWDADGELGVRPVYAHGSVTKERRAIADLGGKARVQGFYQSDCTILIASPLAVGSYKLVVKNEAKQKRRVAATSPLPAGKYLLNTIITRSQDVELSTPNNTRIATQLATLVAAGLSRA